MASSQADNNPRFTLRPIENTPADLATLRDLIMELAVYEKSPDSAKATPELLRTNLFERKHANAIFAVEKETNLVIGFALYFFTFSTWTGRPGLYLEDLFVKDSHRSLGVGKALFARLGRIAKEEGCPRMDWVVLDWNEPAIKFYNGIGAREMSEWKGMRLEGQALQDLENLA